MQIIPQDKSDYWNEYYASRSALKLSAPSQFAAFVAQEAGDAHLIVEIGCGNGRDSLFFARHGFQVVAIDGSGTAIATCEESRKAQSLGDISFLCSTVGSAGFADALRQARAHSDGPAMAYARFFLHAITDAEELAFFDGISAALREGDRLAVEYRTVRDATGAKVTAAHFRRFVEPAQVVANAARVGLVAEYEVEGFGFAKYLSDDAYVARAIFRKTAT
ncbi:MAG: class I SAM-dependent methyltransferase [Paracoccus sp. (in: a-proteobacteria)]